MSATLRQKFGHELLARFSYDAAFNFALVAAGIAAVVHMVWFVASFIAFRRRIDAATMVIVDWDPSVFMMHIRIGLALLISIVGLSTRRVIGLIFAASALAWVGVEYVGWFFWSIRIKSSADIKTFSSSVPHALNLYGGTLWNAVVLVLAVVVLLLVIRQAIRIVESEMIPGSKGSKLGR